MKGGYCWWCKECSRAKEREHYATHLEGERARGRAKSTNPHEKIRRRAYHRAWYLRNREAKLVQNAEWSRAHPNEHKALIQQWFIENHDKSIEYTERRRALKSNATLNDFTEEQWQELLQVYQHRCAYCGIKSARLTRDHITPLSKGGDHTASNIIPACKSCNSKKHTGAAPSPVQPVLLTIAPSSPVKKKKE